LVWRNAKTGVRVSLHIVEADRRRHRRERKSWSKTSNPDCGWQVSHRWRGARLNDVKDLVAFDTARVNLVRNRAREAVMRAVANRVANDVDNAGRRERPCRRRENIRKRPHKDRSDAPEWVALPNNAITLASRQVVSRRSTCIADK
jgi:hypothetical protein